MKPINIQGTKINNLFMSLHSIQRSNQRGIRKNDINIINQEGDHFESSHDTELQEVFFTKKGTFGYVKKTAKKSKGSKKKTKRTRH